MLENLTSSDKTDTSKHLVPWRHNAHARASNGSNGTKPHWARKCMPRHIELIVVACLTVLATFNWLLACVCYEKQGNHNKRSMTCMYELKQTSVWYCHQQTWDPRRQDLPNQPLGFLLVLNRDVHVQTPHQVTQVDLNREEKEYLTATDCAHGPLSCTETSSRQQYPCYK